MVLVSYIQFLSTISKYVKGCILIFEYSYFYSQAKADQKDVIALAVKEYQESRIQSTVVVALQHTIQKHDKDDIKLQQAIFDIIVENRMCKFVLFINEILNGVLFEQSNLIWHSSQKIRLDQTRFFVDR